MLILLKMLPNLECLNSSDHCDSYDIERFYPQSLLFNLLERTREASEWPLALQKLKTFRADYHQCGEEYNLPYFVAVFPGPELTTLHLRNIEEMLGTSDSLPPGAESRLYHNYALTHIYLDNVLISREPLERLINSCKALVHFALIGMDNPHRYLFEEDPENRSLLEALRKHRKSLKVLQFVGRVNRESRHHTDIWLPPLESLNGFSQLHFLHIDLRTLLGPDLEWPLVPLLPPNLRDLRLSTGNINKDEDDHEEMWDTFGEELAAAKNYSMFPNLVNISLDHELTHFYEHHL